MNPVNVLFILEMTESLQTHLQERLAKLDEINLIFPEKAEESEFRKFAPTAQIIVGWRPSPELLDNAQQLKLFIFPGAGVQHLLEWFRTKGRERNVVLVNDHENSYFVAQHTVSLLLALLNKIIPHHNWMANGEWRKGEADAKTMPLRGRTIGLLGYGAINQKVHRFLSGFDVDFAIRQQINFLPPLRDFCLPNWPSSSISLTRSLLRSR